jgi:glycosyltransferase involved in cell wall biosynthesis
VDRALFDPDRIPAAERRGARALLGADDDDFVVMFIGTFGLWHGAEIFAKAITLLAEESPRSRIRFAFVGDGKTRALCEEIIRQAAGTSRQVTFTGLVPQHEAPKFLAAADAFVSPHVPNADGSRFFGSPTKLFEYMAMARPIVASALDQIGQVLEDGRTAILVKPGDAAELAEGIRRLAADRRLGRRLGVAAREEVLAKYTWKRHVEEILGALGRSLGPSSK